MGVSLANARVGVLRAALRFGATHCSRTLRMPHAAAFGCFTLFLNIYSLYLVLY
ncbi:MAG: hypothetical protein RML94_10780 [Bacteroidia bacterium]|nr:hypothetical protein [Bacteroidia bacterium]